MSRMIAVVSSSFGDVQGMRRDMGFLIRGVLLGEHASASAGDGLMRPPLSEEKKPQAENTVFPGRRIGSLEDVLHASLLPKGGSRLEMALVQNGEGHTETAWHLKEGGNSAMRNTALPSVHYLAHPRQRDLQKDVQGVMHEHGPHFAKNDRRALPHDEPRVFHQPQSEPHHYGLQRVAYLPVEEGNAGYTFGGYAGSVGHRAYNFSPALISPLHWQRELRYSILSRQSEIRTMPVQRGSTDKWLVYQVKKEATSAYAGKESTPLSPSLETAKIGPLVRTGYLQAEKTVLPLEVAPRGHINVILPMHHKYSLSEEKPPMPGAVPQITPLVLPLYLALQLHKTHNPTPQPYPLETVLYMPSPTLSHSTFLPALPTNHHPITTPALPTKTPLAIPALPTMHSIAPPVLPTNRYLIATLALPKNNLPATPTLPTMYFIAHPSPPKNSPPSTLTLPAKEVLHPPLLQQERTLEQSIYLLRQEEAQKGQRKDTIQQTNAASLPPAQIRRANAYQMPERRKDISSLVEQAPQMPHSFQAYAAKRPSARLRQSEMANGHARVPYGAGFSPERIAEMKSHARLMRDTFGAEFTYSIEDRLTGSVIGEGGRKPVPPASAIKMALACAALYLMQKGVINPNDRITGEYVEQLEKSGKLRRHEKASPFKGSTPNALLDEIISNCVSGDSNDRSNILLHWVGYENFNNAFKELGLKNTWFVDNTPFVRKGSYREIRSSADDLRQIMKYGSSELGPQYRSRFMSLLNPSDEKAEEKRMDNNWNYFFTPQQYDSLIKQGLEINVRCKVGRTEHETSFAYELEAVFRGKKVADQAGVYMLSSTKERLLDETFRKHTPTGTQATNRFYEFMRIVGQGIIESIQEQQGTIQAYRNAMPGKAA